MTRANKRWAVCSLLVLFVVANTTYWVGFDRGINYTAHNTDKVCSAWWFNGDARRINQAKMWMCNKGKK